jgi:hypothetical protein
VVNCVDEEGEAEDVGEEDEFLEYAISTSFSAWGNLAGGTYVSDIAAYLPYFH